MDVDFVHYGLKSGMLLNFFFLSSKAELLKAGLR